MVPQIMRCDCVMTFSPGEITTTKISGTCCQLYSCFVYKVISSSILEKNIHIFIFYFLSFQFPIIIQLERSVAIILSVVKCEFESNSLQCLALHFEYWLNSPEKPLDVWSICLTVRNLSIFIWCSWLASKLCLYCIWSVCEWARWRYMNFNE